MLGEVLTGNLPEMIGSSADLTGSNLTRTAATAPSFTQTGSGRYVIYGVREFAMAAAMNGMAGSYPMAAPSFSSRITCATRSAFRR